MADTPTPTVEELCQRAKKSLKAGFPKEAIAAYEQARRSNDLDADVHEGMANAYCRLAEYDAAVRHFEMVTRLDPRRSAPWINLGAVYNRLKNYQKAAEVLRRAVQIDRKSSIGYYNLGIAYKHLKQGAMAIPAYREAIRLDPKMADAYLNLGNVYLEMGNLSQATAQFKKALEINPQLERARRGLEKSDARVDAAKKSLSPFGRLVNPDTIHQTDQSPSRELTDDERQQDRHALFDLVAQTQADLTELMDCLRERIDPAVRTLNRLLTHQKSMHGEMLTKGDAFEQFQEAHTAFAPRLRQFRHDLEQLRDHEAKLK
jgi:tetratricopeptide (TPR) repeat protein